MSGGGLTFMGDLCDIQRRSNEQEPYGSDAVYEFHLQGVPCRYVENRSEGVNSLTGEFVITIMTDMMVKGDEDIQGGDKITNIYLDREHRVENEHKDPIEFIVDDQNIRRRGRLSEVKIFALKAIV